MRSLEDGFRAYIEQRLEREREYKLRQRYENPWPGEWPVDRTEIAEEPPKTEEEINAQFLNIMATSLPRKQLTIKDKVLHEMQLGEVEDFKKARQKEIADLKKSNVSPPKYLCGVCFDPMCVYSD